MTRILSYSSPTYRSPAKATPAPGLRFGLFGINPNGISKEKTYSKSVFDEHKDKFEKALDGILEELNKTGQGTFQKIYSGGPWELANDSRWISIIRNNNVKDAWLDLSVVPEKEGLWKRTVFAARASFNSEYLGNPALSQEIKDKVQTLRSLFLKKNIECYKDVECLIHKFDLDPDDSRD